MAIGVPVQLGNASGVASGSTFATGSSSAVGGTIIVIVTVLTASATITSVVDNAATPNTYTAQVNATGNTNRVAIFSAPVTTTLPSGGTIKVTLSSGNYDAVAIYVTNINATATQTNNGTGTSTTTPASISTGTLTQAVSIVVGAVGTVGGSMGAVTMPSGGGYTANTQPANQQMGSGYVIVASTASKAWNPTFGTARGYVSVVAAFRTNLFSQAVTGTASNTRTLVKVANKNVLTTASDVASMVRRVAKSIVGTAGSGASLSLQKSLSTTLTATAGSSASLVKSTLKALTWPQTSLFGSFVSNGLASTNANVSTLNATTLADINIGDLVVLSFVGDLRTISTVVDPAGNVYKRAAVDATGPTSEIRFTQSIAFIPAGSTVTINLTAADPGFGFSIYSVPILNASAVIASYAPPLASFVASPVTIVSPALGFEAILNLVVNAFISGALTSPAGNLNTPTLMTSTAISAVAVGKVAGAGPFSGSLQWTGAASGRAILAGFYVTFPAVPSIARVVNKNLTVTASKTVSIAKALAHAMATATAGNSPGLVKRVNKNLPQIVTPYLLGANSTTNAGPSSFTITTTADAPAGSLIVICSSSANNPGQVTSIDDSALNSYAQIDPVITGLNIQQNDWHAINIANDLPAGGSINIHYSATGARAVAICLPRIGPVVLDSHNNTATGTTGTSSTAVVTGTSRYTNRIVFGLFNFNGNGALPGAFTPGAPFTDIGSSASTVQAVDMAYYLTSDNSSISWQDNWVNNGQSWITNVVAYGLPPASAGIATLTASKAFGKALSATAGSAASIAKTILKALSATSVHGGVSLRKRVNKPLSITAGASASLSEIKAKTLTLTATAGSSASIIKLVVKGISLTSTGIASLLRVCTKTLTATSSSAATLSRLIGKSLTTTAGSVASLIAVKTSTTFFQTVSATASSSASIVKTVLHGINATASSAASLARVCGKALTATSNHVATITRQIGKTLSTTAGSSATLAELKAKFLTLSATAGSTASLSKQLLRTISATASSSATLVKMVLKALTTTVSSSASLTVSKVKLLTLTATSVHGGVSLRKRVNKPLTASAGSVAAIAKACSKALSAVQSIGVASIFRSINKSLTANAGSSAALAAKKVLQRALAATATSAPSLARTALKALAATAMVIPSLSLRIAKNLSAASSGVASLSIAAFRRQVLSATATVIASLVAAKQSTSITLMAISVHGGVSLRKRVIKPLAATSGSVATLAKRASVTLTAVAGSIVSLLVIPPLGKYIDLRYFRAGWRRLRILLGMAPVRAATAALRNRLLFDAQRGQRLMVGDVRRRTITLTVSPIMSQTLPLLPPIDSTAEQEIITFDFGFLLAGVGASITSIISLTCSVASNSQTPDTNPTSRLIGSPQIVNAPQPPTGSGAQNGAVAQMVGGMIGGCTYVLQCVVATTSGEHKSLWAHLPCVTPS